MPAPWGAVIPCPKIRLYDSKEFFKSRETLANVNVLSLFWPLVIFTLVVLDFCTEMISILEMTSKISDWKNGNGIKNHLRIN